MNDTQQRFLRVIADRVPVARIVELHLFAPIRQGNAETGVAVFAALTDVPVVDDVAADPATIETSTDDISTGDMSTADGGLPGDAPSGDENPERPTPPPIPPDEPSPPEDPAPHESPPDMPPVGDPPDDAPPIEDPPAGDVPTADPPMARQGSAEPTDTLLFDRGTPDDAAPVPRPVVVRHVVMSARYRLVLKGVDRGTWEVDVTEEADAPLITVDKVVRGVLRRAGDLADVERFTSDTLQQALSETLWATTA